MIARIRQLAWGTVSFVLRCVLVLILLEGAASIAAFVLALPDALERPIAERLHTQYDPELGWVHEPGLHLEDFYGPARNLTVSAQGFRGAAVLAPEPPPGRLRTVCSGDSFTLGYGVDDRDTWCARLEALEPQLETVNMGQGGYGIDQSYLWFRRDGLALDPDLHLFAFIREDFGRMQSAEFLDYGKPVLRVAEGGELEVRNVPVPRSAYRMPWLVQNAELIERLRIVQLARPIVRTLLPEQSDKLTMAQLAGLTLRVFEELQALHREDDSTLVLVYLPTREDYRNPRDLWRRRIRAEARQRGLHFVDLVESLKQLSRREVAELYIPDGFIDFPGADGHFNEAGNAWVAREILEALRAIPEVATRLRGSQPS